MIKDAQLVGFAGGAYIAKAVKTLAKMTPEGRISFVIGALAGIRSVSESASKLIDPNAISDFAENCDDLDTRIALNDAVDWLRAFEKERITL